MNRANRVSILRSVLPWVLLGALIAVDGVVFRTPSLNILSDLLSAAVALAGGFVAAWTVIRRRPRIKLVRLLAVCALAGMVVAMVQFSLRWDFFDVVVSPWWGLMLGGFGGVLYLAVERAPKRRQTPDEERRFRKVLVDHDMSDPKNET